METKKKCVSSGDAWSQDSADCSSAVPQDYSPTARAVLMLQWVGLLQPPHPTASWRPTILMLIWMLAPAVFIVSFMVINVQKFLAYQGSSYFKGINKKIQKIINTNNGIFNNLVKQYTVGNHL